MHYTSTIASRNFGQKTMTAKFNPVSCLRKFSLIEIIIPMLQVHL